MRRTIAIVALIARSKLVPDFALTIHFLHLLFTSLYSRSVPRNLMWWLAMAISSALSVALGMWGCRYRELQPVFFGGGRILGSNATPAAAQTHNDEHQNGVMPEDGGPAGGDEEMGLSRGRGRQRGMEEYEMDKMDAKR